MQRAGRFAPLDAVQTGGGQPQWSQQFVEIMNAAPADQRDRSAQALGHMTQQRLELRVRKGFQRRVRQLDESSVDVQKQTPFERWRRQRLHQHSLQYRRRAWLAG